MLLFARVNMGFENFTKVRNVARQVVAAKATSSADHLVKITVSVNKLTVPEITISTPFQMPFPIASLVCDDENAKCWIKSISGSDVCVSVSTTSDVQTSGMVLLRTCDGASAYTAINRSE